MRLNTALLLLWLATQPAPAQEQQAPQPQETQPVELVFTNASIETVISTIMRELGYSYMIDPQVSGTVNLFTSGGVPKAKLFEILEQILKMNGHAIVRQKDLYFIVPFARSLQIPHEVVTRQDPKVTEPKAEQKPEEKPPQQAEEKPPQQAEEKKEQGQSPAAQEPAPGEAKVLKAGAEDITALGGDQGVITYIIPLHYIPSSLMVTMIKPFVSDGATVIDFASSNMLFLHDYRKNIQQVLNLVNLLDTQYFNMNSVELVPIQYNRAKDIAEDLVKIFAPDGKAAGVRIVAIERLNSLLVVTQSASVMREVKGWIDRLDTPSAGTNVKTFVYQVENNTAANIAEVLAQLYEGGMGLPSAAVGEAKEGEAPPSAAAARQREPATTPGYLPSFQGGPMAGIRSELGPSLTGRPMSSQPGVRAVVAGNIRIIVNEFNNSLIVQATEADYLFLLQTIKQLDVLPRQVVIEARIYSVELRDDLKFGVAAFLEKKGAENVVTDPKDPSKQIVVPPGPPTTGEISPPSGSSEGGGLSLATRAFIGMERQLEALINALRSRTNVELLEAPRIMATDGMQAQINVGAEVPVTTSSFGDPLRGGTAGAFINSIQFRPTGTTLLIMPRITAGGIVTMDLAVEVSSATGTALTPTINRNYVETSLIVKDGQTVAIAGIISEQLSVGRSRVPLLGDIPIMGALFGQTSRNKRRSELVFFITPHVIPNLPTATELTLDFQRALKKGYEFIRHTEAERTELIQKRRQEELEQQQKLEKEKEEKERKEKEKKEPN